MPDNQAPSLSTGVQYRPDIQGVRAIAVGLVVLAHAKVSGFDGGFIGVDVFFVLSGYLITGLLVEERILTGTIHYGRFLARRLRRLLPAMLAMLVLVLTVSTVLLTAYEMRMQSRSFPFAAAWVSNFFFAFAEQDYFEALTAQDLFLHTWSLGVEEQFYLMWPWLILAFVGLRTRDGTRRSTGNVVFAAFSIIFAASLVLSLFLSQTLPILSFYMMPARVWQFALGSAVYVGLHVARESGGAPARLAGPAGLAGLALVLGSATMLSSSINYPGHYALFPSIGAALIIAAGKLSADAGLTRLLQSRPFVWIGDRSYSIYLWHWPVLILGNSFGVSRSIAGLVMLVLLSVLLAAMSYRYIEYPFWKGRYRTARPGLVVTYSALAIIMATGLSLGLEKSVYGKTARSLVAQDYDPRQDAPSKIYRAGQNCDTGHFGSNVVPCPVGNKDGESLAILWGDSVGAQWSPLVEGVFSSPEWQVLVLTKSACAIVDKTYYYRKVGGDYTVCTEWRNKVIDYITALEPDALIIGSSAFYEFSEADWVGGTSRILAPLSKVAKDVVVIAGAPRLSFYGPSCLEDPWRFSFRLTDSKRECEEPQADDTPDEVVGYLQQSANDFSNVDVLDLGDLVCPDRRCAAQSVDGIAVFRDKVHVTASFAQSIVPEVRERIERIGVSINPARLEPDTQ
jgi:peptidoglycan/LPS O-acetylase OafA/YrhL